MNKSRRLFPIFLLSCLFFFITGLSLQGGSVPPAAAAGSAITGNQPSNAEDFEYTMLGDGTLAIIKYLGNDVKVLVPSQYNGLPISEIRMHAFIDQENLQTVVLEEGIKTIRMWAFSNCPRLTDIQLPNSLEVIEMWAFDFYDKYITLMLPDNLSALDYNPFESSIFKLQVSENNKRYEVRDGVLIDKIDQVLVRYPQWSQPSVYKVPEGIVMIAESAFSSSNNLETIVLPKSLRVIKDNAFYGCNQLSSAVLPEGLEVIGAGAFQSCNQLQEIRMPTTLKKIESAAFAYCTGLQSVILNEGLKELDSWIFHDCTQLQRIDLPASLEVIEGNPAANFTTRIHIHPDNPYYTVDGNCIIDQRNGTLIALMPKGLKGTLSLSPGIKHVAAYAVYLGGKYTQSSVDVREVIIPEGVLSIAYSGISVGEKVKSITLPRSVISMNRSAIVGASASPILKMYSDSYAASWVEENYDLSMVQFLDDAVVPSAPNVVGKWGYIRSTAADKNDWRVDFYRDVVFEFRADGRLFLTKDGMPFSEEMVRVLEYFDLPQVDIDAALNREPEYYYSLYNQTLQFGVFVGINKFGYGDSSVRTTDDTMYLKKLGENSEIVLTRIP